MVRNWEHILQKILSQLKSPAYQENQKTRKKIKYFFFVTKTIKPKQEKQGQFYKKKTRNNRIKKQ